MHTPTERKAFSISTGDEAIVMNGLNKEYAPRSMSLEASVGGSAPRSVNVDAPHEHVRPWPAYGLEERSQRTRLQSGAHAPDAPGPAVFQGLAIYLAFLLCVIVRVARSIVVNWSSRAAAVQPSRVRIPNLSGSLTEQPAQL